MREIDVRSARNALKCLFGRAEPRRRLTLVEPDEDVPVSHSGQFRAADLAALLKREVFDAEDAAAFLHIARNSIEYACHRGRIPFVQYGAKKLFTRRDLMDYHSKRGRGRDSQLEDVPSHVVKP